MHDRSEWRRFETENTTVVSCHGDMKPLNGESLQFKGIKGKNFLFLNILLLVFSWHDACTPNGGGKM